MSFIEGLLEKLGVTMQTMTREELTEFLLWSNIESLSTMVSEPEIFDD